MSGRGGYHGPRTHDSPGGVGASPSRGRGGRGGAAGHSTGNSSSSPFCSWREPAAPEGSPGAGAFGSLQGGRGGRGRGGGGGRGRGGHTSRGGHHNCNSGRGGGGGRGRGRGRGASAAAAAPVAMRRDRPYRPGDEFIRPDAAISSDEEYHVIDEGVLAEFGMRDVDFNRADSSGAGSGDTTDDDNAIDERFADDLAALQAELGAEDHSELDDEGKDYNIYGEEDDGEEEEDSEDDDDLDEELLAAIGAAPAPSASLDRFITAAAGTGSGSGADGQGKQKKNKQNSKSKLAASTAAATTSTPAQATPGKQTPQRKHAAASSSSSAAAAAAPVSTPARGQRSSTNGSGSAARRGSDGSADAAAASASAARSAPSSSSASAALVGLPPRTPVKGGAAASTAQQQQPNGKPQGKAAKGGQSNDTSGSGSGSNCSSNSAGIGGNKGQRTPSGRGGTGGGSGGGGGGGRTPGRGSSGNNNSSGGGGAGTPGGGGGGGDRRPSYFADHMTVEEALKGIRAGTLLCGALRINAKRRAEAYVTIPGLGVDVFAEGDKDRNRALEGDLVALQVMDRSEWRSKGGANGARAVSLAAAGLMTEDDDDEEEAESSGVNLAAIDELSRQLAAQLSVSPSATSGTTAAAVAVKADDEAALLPEQAAALTQSLYAPRVSLAAKATAADDDAASSSSPAPAPALSSIYPKWLSDAMGSEAYGASVKALRMLATLPDNSNSSSDTSSSGDAGAAPNAALTAIQKQPRARVVAIMKQVHPRTVIGVLRPSDESSSLEAPVPDRHAYVRLVPLDQRIPWVMIPRHEAPKEFLARPASHARTLFAGQLNSRWPPQGRFPLGHLLQSIGEAGEIGAETDALLRQAAVRDGPFSEEVMACLRPFEAQLVDITVPATLPPQPPVPVQPAAAPAAGAAVAAVVGGSHHGMSAGEAPAEAMTSSAPPATGTHVTVTPETPAAAAASGVASLSTVVKKSWAIPPDEIARRRDLRSYRIFTCDPWNAKDLDDALHIIPLDPDAGSNSSSRGGVQQQVFEVGVHIADVSHFVTPGNALDEEAAARCTSTYLVQRVIPMLPPLLCEELCSLNPGVDRLAFSVIWRMRSDGTIVEDYPPWYGKTVIRSVSKLDYGTAQRMIDGTISEDMAAHPERIASDLWAPDRRPGAAAAAAGSAALSHSSSSSLTSSSASSAGDPVHSCLDVWRDVRLMHAVAMERRRKRFAAGALALNKNKLVFKLDADGNPIGVDTYPVRDSNRMIEEFMLLANYLVAEKLLLGVGDCAVLRRHPKLQADRSGAVTALAKELGLRFDLSTAGDIHNSLLEVYRSDPAAGKVLEYLVTKPMKPAQYFATGSVPREEWGHYALAMPYYTHFTSPIRRYADVMVHRLLALALGAPPAARDAASAGAAGSGQQGPSAAVTSAALPPWAHVDALSAQCDLCNERKAAAKEAQERSDLVYFAVYLRSQPAGGLEAEAVVCDVSGDKGFSLLIPAFDLERKVFLDRNGWEGIFTEKTRSLRIRPAGTGARAAADADSAADGSDSASGAGTPARQGRGSAAAGTPVPASASASKPSQRNPRGGMAPPGMSNRVRRRIGKWLKRHPDVEARVKAGEVTYEQLEAQLVEVDAAAAAAAVGGADTAAASGAEEGSGDDDDDYGAEGAPAATSSVAESVATPAPAPVLYVPPPPPPSPSPSPAVVDASATAADGASAAAGAASSTSKPPAAWIPPASGHTIRHMSRLLVWLSAAVDQVPLDVSVTVLGPAE